MSDTTVNESEVTEVPTILDLESEATEAPVETAPVEEAPKPVAKKTRSRAKAAGAARDTKETKVTAKKTTTPKTRATTKKAVAKKAATKPRAAGIGRAEGSAKGGRAKPPADARERGGLELDVKAVTDAFVDGKIDTGGKPLTPHRISSAIVDLDGVDRKPSTGAITNVLRRWADYGFALVDEKPVAFRRYSAAGQKQGLDALRTKFQEKAKAERTKARAAAKGE